MSEHLFWLADDSFDRLKPLSPNKGRGDDRKVISGIIHVIRYGLKWRDAPACSDPTRPSTTASCARAFPYLMELSRDQLAKHSNFVVSDSSQSAPNVL